MTTLIFHYRTVQGKDMKAFVSISITKFPSRATGIGPAALSHLKMSCFFLLYSTVVSFASQFSSAARFGHTLCDHLS